MIVAEKPVLEIGLFVEADDLDSTGSFAVFLKTREAGCATLYNDGWDISELSRRNVKDAFENTMRHAKRWSAALRADVTLRRDAECLLRSKRIPRTITAVI